MSDAIRILCVDDERNVLRAIERLFLDEPYEILTAASGDEGLAALKDLSPIQIVVSDYRMPKMNGVDFLREVFKGWPDTVRIVLSGYADTAAVVSAINEGQIYKFIPKPWNDDELKVTISNAVEHYSLQQRNAELTTQLKIKNQELEQINRNLETLVQDRTADLVFQNKVLARSQSILDAVPVAVLGVDEEGLVVQCNRKGGEIIGVCEGMALGAFASKTLPHAIETVIQASEERGAAMGRVSIGGVLLRIRTAPVRHDGAQGGVVVVLYPEVENE